MATGERRNVASDASTSVADAGPGLGIAEVSRLFCLLVGCSAAAAATLPRSRSASTMRRRSPSLHAVATWSGAPCSPAPTPIARSLFPPAKKSCSFSRSPRQRVSVSLPVYPPPLHASRSAIARPPPDAPPRPRSPAPKNSRSCGPNHALVPRSPRPIACAAYSLSRAPCAHAAHAHAPSSACASPPSPMCTSALVWCACGKNAPLGGHAGNMVMSSRPVGGGGKGPPRARGLCEEMSGRKVG
ncbi:hypothetical protein JB92DRAFT_2931739 [Gautieria morchelliformis]|nr:hypothetical protein JB92DRAFT_2931739 [Gautieria morchelliformis]